VEKCDGGRLARGSTGVNPGTSDDRRRPGHACARTVPVAPRVSHHCAVDWASQRCDDRGSTIQARNEEPSRGPAAERKATDFEITLGRKLGMSKSGLDFLEDYRDNVEKHKAYYLTPP
jgi:hypothetical protein